LKNWLAFIALKKKIDDFHESLPLVEMMAHPSMQKRHWGHLESITGYTFNTEEEFSLKNVMQAPLLQNKEEIEVDQLKP
jgi:dynein heavy chain